MSDEHAPMSAEFLASVQPIVLVGGKSTRFGRDKLREPVGEAGELLVQRPINALRAVFGPRAKLVGECHPSIVPLADGVIPDEFPGIGPMGGILSALWAWAGPIFVLAGDMPEFDSRCVRVMAAAAEADSFASAVVAYSDRVHPTAGVYRQTAGPVLQARKAQGIFRLGDAIRSEHFRLVPINAANTVNLNRQDELSIWTGMESHSGSMAIHIADAGRSTGFR